MKDFDLKKYLAESKLLKEEVSLDDFLKNQLTGIEDETEGTKTVEKEEWLDMFGGTKNESGFDDIYNLIEKGKNSHSIDFGDFKANYDLKIGNDKIIIKYKVKEDLAENKLEERETEFTRNRPARIDQFISELDNLLDDYHAELYLKDDVFSGIEAVKRAALGPNTATEN